MGLQPPTWFTLLREELEKRLRSQGKGEMNCYREPPVLKDWIEREKQVPDEEPA